MVENYQDLCRSITSLFDKFQPQEKYMLINYYEIGRLCYKFICSMSFLRLINFAATSHVAESCCQGILEFYM